MYLQVPDGQELEEYLQMEPMTTGSATLPPMHTAEHQPLHRNPGPTPFTFVTPPDPPSHSVQKPQHPFFDRFPKNSQTPNPAVLREPTPLIAPRVLLRQPSGTTRHPHVVSTSGTPTPATNLANSEGDKTLEAAARSTLPRTVLSTSSNTGQSPKRPAVAVPSKPQVITPANGPQTPSTASQNEQVFRNGPSQQVFRRLARLDPEALRFQDGDFLVMMDLRAEHKWDSRRMGTTEWDNAVQLFNKRRQEKQPNRDMVPMQAKIFQDEFLKAERTISQRLVTRDFQGPFVFYEYSSAHAAQLLYSQK